VLSIQPASCFQVVLPGSWLHAVPGLLTLYAACMPCTASTSHAAWDVEIGPGPGTDMLDCPESDPKRR
jgi:hypothetical protein